jgi:hypothetical protein
VKIEKSRRIVESRPVCLDLYARILKAQLTLNAGVEVQYELLSSVIAVFE